MNNSFSAIAFIQARLGSTRLPGKVFAKLNGKNVLEWVITRLKESKKLDDLVLLTSTHERDDDIEKWAIENTIKVFRGPEDDVLKRFYLASEQYESPFIVRVNADNPLIDPWFIDELIRQFHSTNTDYMSYEQKPNCPAMKTAVSFFAEIFTKEALSKADAEIDDMHLREHVTLGMYTNSDKFRSSFISMPNFCDDQNLRFTLDVQSDLDFLRLLVKSAKENVLTWDAKAIVEFVKSKEELWAFMSNNAEANKK